MFIESHAENMKRFEEIRDASLARGRNSIGENFMSAYNAIANSNAKYVDKQTMFTTGTSKMPCNDKCMPFLGNSVMLYLLQLSERGDITAKEKVNFMKNPTCYFHCGNPSCPMSDPNGSIDVRMFSYKQPGFSEFREYYSLRPPELMKMDIKRHEESVGMHNFMQEFFSENGEIRTKIKIALS